MNSIKNNYNKDLLKTNIHKSFSLVRKNFLKKPKMNNNEFL